MHLRNTMAYCLFCFFGAIMLATPRLNAADLDNDGLDDAWETANGYSTLLYTHIVYVDAVNGDDVTGDGGTAATALKSLGAALALNFTAGDENVILAAPGTYSGAANRELDFNGMDIWLRASGGAAQTIIDLEGAGRLLALTHGETLSSRLDGFTVRNGYKASCGTAVHLSGASLTIRDCVFEDNRSGRKVEYDYGEWIETWWEDADSTAAVFAEDAPVRIIGTVFRRNASSETMYGGMWMDNAGALSSRTARSWATRARAQARSRCTARTRHSADAVSRETSRFMKAGLSPRRSCGTGMMIRRTDATCPWRTASCWATRRSATIRTSASDRAALRR